MAGPHWSIRHLALSARASLPVASAPRTFAGRLVRAQTLPGHRRRDVRTPLRDFMLADRASLRHVVRRARGRFFALRFFFVNDVATVADGVATGALSERALRGRSMMQ